MSTSTESPRTFFAMFDSCEVYETSTGFDITESGDGFRPEDSDGMITVSSHDTKEQAFDAAQARDDRRWARTTRVARPVDQRHYQTGCGVEGERLYMPDR